jgi:hypothetical protein
MGHERGRCATLKLAGCFGRKQTFNLAIVNDRDWSMSVAAFSIIRPTDILVATIVVTGE